MWKEKPFCAPFMLVLANLVNIPGEPWLADCSTDHLDNIKLSSLSDIYDGETVASYLFRVVLNHLF